MNQHPSFKVAAAHVSPVFLDLERTVEKTCSLIREASENGAELIVFPETYIAAFPVWLALQAPIHNHKYFERLAASTIRCPGPEITRIAETVRECGIFASVGFNEGTDASVGCIWNSNVLIGDDGKILCHHRKIVPTYYEKLVWARGDGGGLMVNETRIGRLGMLICGENTNPLARYSLIAQGEQVHLATYPPIWPTHSPEDAGSYDLKQAIQIRAGAHSFEGKLFTVVASAFLDKDAWDEMASLNAEAGGVLEASPRGVSLVTGPGGLPVSEIVQDEECLLYVDIDLSACVEPKQIHDVAGGYNRFDIFKLTVDRSAQRPITFLSEYAGEEVEDENGAW